MDNITYYKKYIKYKTKYLNLRKNQIGGKEPRYSIVCLCMLKDHYVIGSCICAFVHKYMISLQKRKIELTVMCDDYIYDKWHTTLKEYFDNVKRIKLIEYGLSDSYAYAKKKYDWMQYAPNKWECLNFTEFDRILFCDVDMLPVDPTFYDLFEYNVPAVHRRYVFAQKENLTLEHFDDKCIDNSMVTEKNTYKSVQGYIMGNTSPIGTLDAGLVLIEPSKELHDSYYDFVSETYKHGVYSILGTGVDETSLFYFLTKRGPIYEICRKFIVTPWDSNSEYVKKALLYNFLSFIKPWAKARILQWDEEVLWSDIYDIMPKSKKFIDLYETQIKQQYEEFKKMNSFEKRKYFYGANFNIVNDKNLLTYKRTSTTYGMLDIKQLAGIFDKYKN